MVPVKLKREKQAQEYYPPQSVPHSGGQLVPNKEPHHQHDYKEGTGGNHPLSQKFHFVSSSAFRKISYSSSISSLDNARSWVKADIISPTLPR